MCARLKGKKSLSASTLPERENDSLYTNPSGEGKRLCVQSLQERERLLVYSPFRGVKRLLVYSFKMHLSQINVSNSAKTGSVPVRSRLRRFLPKWKNQKVHQSNCHSENAQNYPGFPASPASTQVSDKQNALLTCIQDLL